jgi:hypothetical protein
MWTRLRPPIRPKICFGRARQAGLSEVDGESEANAGFYMALRSCPFLFRKPTNIALGDEFSPTHPTAVTSISMVFPKLEGRNRRHVRATLERFTAKRMAEHLRLHEKLLGSGRPIV